MLMEDMVEKTVFDAQRRLAYALCKFPRRFSLPKLLCKKLLAQDSESY